MKLWVPGVDNFLLAEGLSASHGLCSMKLVCELIHLKQTQIHNTTLVSSALLLTQSDGVEGK